MDLHTKTLAELAAGLDSREYSSVELTRSLLDRIATHDKTLNAFVTVTADEALASAERADKARAAGEVTFLADRTWLDADGQRRFSD